MKEVMSYLQHILELLETARSVRPGGDLRAERNLLQASQCLEGDLE